MGVEGTIIVTTALLIYIIYRYFKWKNGIHK